MDRFKQYEALVEIVAQARLLAAMSNDDDVVKNAEAIKRSALSSATKLGFSDAKFMSDSIVRYEKLPKRDWIK